MLRLAALIGLVAVAACVGPPDATRISQATDLELCQTYGQARVGFLPEWQTAVFDELKRRNVLNQRDLQNIPRNRIQLGMTEVGAVCSWGPYVDRNSTVGPWGVNRQYVMGQFGPYVYTENGIVTSWQN